MSIDWQAAKAHIAQSERLLEQAGSLASDDWPELLQNRAEHLAGRQQQVQQSAQSFIACSCRSQALLIPCLQLQAVQAFKACVPLPQAAPELLGICLFRAEIVSVVDLGRLLGLPGQSQAQQGYLAFVRNTPPLALQLDSLGELRQLKHQELEQLEPSESPYFAGLSSQQELVLDLDKLLQHPFLAKYYLSKEPSS